MLQYNIHCWIKSIRCFIKTADIKVADYELPPLSLLRLSKKNRLYGTMTISLFYWRCDILYVTLGNNILYVSKRLTCNSQLHHLQHDLYTDCTWPWKRIRSWIKCHRPKVIDQMSTFISFSEIERTSNPNIPRYSR